jgi:hypothetical protein
MAVAPLSFTSQFGWYGLRVNPTFDEVLGTVRKPLGIPLPQRTAKWYALSPYRSFILDAENKYQDHESALTEYRKSGAELPESAAQVHPSEAGADPSFDRIDQHNEEHDHQQAHRLASQLEKQEHQNRTEDARAENLYAAYGSDSTNPVIEAAHDELNEAGVPHAIPLPRLVPPQRPWRAPPRQFIASGQPQAPEFPAFQVLNQGQPANINAAPLSYSQNLSYDQVRDFVVQPTWSS